MSNVVKLAFGEERNIQKAIARLAASLAAPPLSLQQGNAELLAHEYYKAYQRFKPVAEADFTWHASDPPELLKKQLQDYSYRLQAIAFDELAYVFYMALVYGCQEKPRARP